MTLGLAFMLCLLLTCANENSTTTNTTPLVDSLPPEIVTVVETPPKQSPHTPDYDTSHWTELILLDSSLILDMKYATTENFVKEQMYSCARCFLRPKAAQVILKIQKELRNKGLGLKFFDCYRPLSIQQALWNKIPDATYVTNPKKGSMHNRGLAVDVTFVDSLGVELDMGTAFDFFGRKAHHTHTDLPKEVLENRRLLKTTMEAAGFKSIRTEWWHYSYRFTKGAVANMEWNCPEN